MSDEEPSVPYGYCECGCGRRTRVASQTSTTYGWVKGKPVRFISGHNNASSRPELIEDADTHCWLWGRYIDPQGYGRTSRNGRPCYVHRLYYEQLVGPVPDGLEIDHLCRNRACVNPGHLEAVTAAENARRGSRTKLTYEQVRKIRGSSASVTDLARQFGVSRQAVSLIRMGRTWRET